MGAMAGPRLQEQQSPQLLGREPECAAIDRLLANAHAGSGGALVVRGEAGIGKSALLDYARQRAAPMAVLSAAGVEAESDLAFAGLQRPVVSCLGELPAIQSQALAGALGLAPSLHADRLLISAAVLGLLAAAAEDRPTLASLMTAAVPGSRSGLTGQSAATPHATTRRSRSLRRPLLTL